MSEYNDDLKIDFAELDINWRDHSANYMKWAEHWVNAVAQRDRKKEALDVLKAELDKHYRIELEKQIGKKPTEATVSAAIISNTTYQVAQQDIIKANEEVNLLAAAKVAFEHRKKALEGLTQLWLGGYFSNPNIPSEIKERVKQSGQGYVDDQVKVLSGNTRMQKRKLKPIKKK
jgi:hypothetical protein